MDQQSSTGFNDGLTPAAQELLKQILPVDFKGWSSLGLETARAAILQMNLLGGPPETVARVEHIAVRNSDGTRVDGVLYIPIPDPPEPLPVFLYLHGGGWVMGDHTIVDSLARTLANRSECAIFSLNYRLAPEHKYPVALEDTYQALQWVVENASRYGLNRQKLGVGGDSAGANLAAAVALLCRDRGVPLLKFQFLAYPVVDHNHENASYRRFGASDPSTLTRADMRWFHDLYTDTAEDLDSPYVSPLKAESLAGLPPTLIVAAEIDPLVQEGAEYAQRLSAAGVPVERKVYAGMFHGFIWTAGVLAEAREAVAYCTEKIRQFMVDSYDRQ